MIDIHCHMLPSIDDGAVDLETALCMAQMAVDDGIVSTVCTPHIYPGVFDNNKQLIEVAVNEFRNNLEKHNINLELFFAADSHMAPDLLNGIKTGRVPTINGSRYLLFEPPHNVAPPGFENFVFELLANGIIPVITHPERLKWIETHYESFVNVARRGAWLQVTANAITGRFGKRAKFWSERMLDENIVHVIATDAHNINHRPPILSAGCTAAEKYVGKDEVARMVVERPQAILNDVSAEDLIAPAGLSSDSPTGAKKKSLFNKLFRFSR